MRPSELPKITTAEQMRAIDKRAIEGMGVPSLNLMENAGRGIAEVIREEVFNDDCQGRRVAVVCGRGNNGGDGFVVGRYLHDWGATVRFILLGQPNQLKGDAAANHKRAVDLKLPVATVENIEELPDLTEYELLVDAIFGTGFHGPIKGVAAEVVDAMNASGVEIVAVDAPSGLDSDSGEAVGSVISASYTISLACSKYGHWRWPGRGYVGHLAVVDIGIPAEAVDGEGVRLAQITEEFVAASLPERPPDGHKGTFGKALILGGSAGMSGAVALAANAAMRCGLGLAYAGVPESIVDLIDIKATEPVVLPFPEVNKRRVLARRGLGEILQRAGEVQAIAIGPGLSQHHETQELVRRLIARVGRPTVLDADGLNAFAKDPSILEAARSHPLIITPHVGEMARLLGRANQDVATDRKQAAIDAARRFGCIVVMKGAPTFVADPGGMVYLNPTGNSGMGSGGVGDVLTGIIVSFLAQGCEPLTAALMGVYLHGRAGDLGADEYGERSLVASDLVTMLPEVLRELEG